MHSFTFKGDWETSIQLDIFQHFRHSYGKNIETYRTINLKIQEDPNSDDPDPSPQQLAAIDYLVTHEAEVAQTLIDYIRASYQDLVDWYGFDEYVEEAEKPFENDDQIKAIIRINNVYIMFEYKDGVSYIGYSGSCAWDEEHGLGFTLHKTRIIDFGSSSESYSNKHEKECDNPNSLKHKDTEVLSDFRSPHPKYNKFKPSEKEAIDAYALRLLKAGKTEDFMDCLNRCRDYSHIPVQLKQRHFLECALNTNNIRAIDYLVSKNNEMFDWIMEGANSTIAIEYLLSKNVPLNTPYRGYKTFWDRTLDRQLSWLLSYLENGINAGTPALAQEYKEIAYKVAVFIKYLLEKGGDTVLINRYFDRWNEQYHSKELKQTMLALLD